MTSKKLTTINILIEVLYLREYEHYSILALSEKFKFTTQEIGHKLTRARGNRNIVKAAHQMFLSKQEEFNNGFSE